jgi:hypothetical protein
METKKIEVVQPNLHVRGNNLFFSTDKNQALPACEYVDRIVAKHLGQLKVNELDLRIITERYVKGEKSGLFTVPLSDYLRKVSEIFRTLSEGGILSLKMDSQESPGYLVSALNLESVDDYCRFISLKRFLEDPEKAFSSIEQILKYDRKASLEAATRECERLAPQMPDNGAQLFVMACPNGAYFAALKLTQVKSKDDSKIQETKKELVEALKGVKGPELSLAAATLAPIAINAYNAPAPYHNREIFALQRDFFAQ